MLRRSVERKATASIAVQPVRGIAMILSACLLWSLAACDDPGASVEHLSVGQVERLPDLELLRLDGTLVRLTELHPGKAIVLNVWAAWCPPCRAEMPNLQRLSDGLDPERFVVIGLSVDEDADFVREYLRDIGITFANYVATDTKAAPAQLKVDSFPQTLLVRTDGSLEQRIVGPRDWAAPQQRARIQTLWAPGANQVTARKARRIP
jgi:thiol-disulfide isomerase/thioredoxin